MKFFKVTTIVLVFTFSTVLCAGDSWGKLGGKAYLNFSATDLGQSTIGTGFQLERVYLTYQKSITKLFSFHVITDIGQVSDSVGNKTTAYTAYIKNAYVKYNQDLGPVVITSMLGMIPVPIMKAQDGLRGFRWVSDSTFHDITQVGFQSSEYKDTTADLGLWISVKIAKMITITGAITNGEGFKDISLAGVDNDYDFSVYTDIRPLQPMGMKEFYINGYFKYDMDEPVIYFGGGLGWDSKSIKAGANYLAFYKTVTGNGKQWQHVVDIYANVNTKKWIGLPVLILARCGLGINSDLYVKNLTSNQIIPVIGAGIGYSLGNTLNAMVYYEYKLEKHNMYLKLEAKI